MKYPGYVEFFPDLEKEQASPNREAKNTCVHNFFYRKAYMASFRSWRNAETSVAARPKPNKASPVHDMVSVLYQNSWMKKIRSKVQPTVSGQQTWLQCNIYFSCLF